MEKNKLRLIKKVLMLDTQKEIVKEQDKLKQLKKESEKK